MQQATYAFIASQLLSKKEKEKIDLVFKAMDANGDGKLSKEEIKSGYATHFGRDISDEEVDDMFSKVDADKNGDIDYSEFVVATMSEKKILNNKNIKAAFDMFDTDGGGSITSDEVKKILSFGQNIDPEAIEEMLAKVDSNKDG